MSSPVQLPPFWRETAPTSQRALAPPWHIADPELPKHWERTGGGHGIRVGVADTGIDIGHPEIAGRVLKVRDAFGRDAADRNGHGTHCATTIAGSGVGVAPKAELLIAKVLDDNGSGDSRECAAGIDWLVNEGCHIISLSWGGSTDDEWTRQAVQRAIDAGCLVFAATGNERAKRVGYPASHCVGVGAVDRRLRLADFSNRGKDVDCVGYGVDILAGVPGGKYQSMSGTSMATPFIAGIAANRLSAELRTLGRIVTRSPADMLRLADYVKDLGPDGMDHSYGRGFPDLSNLFTKQLSVDAPTIPAETVTARIEEVGTGRVWTGLLQPERPFKQ